MLVELARERILSKLGPGCVFVVAAAPEIAFGLAAPFDATHAEVAFVGTAPARWREGLGARVLQELTGRLAESGFRSAELLVYLHNVGAIALYERLGWVPASGELVRNPRTGKPMRRYLCELSGPESPA